MSNAVKVPGVYLTLKDQEPVMLPDSTGMDTIRWERHFGIVQGSVMKPGEQPMLEHLMYTFFLRYSRLTDVRQYADFEEFVNDVVDMDLVEDDEAADPQTGAEEPSA